MVRVRLGLGLGLNLGPGLGLGLGLRLQGYLAEKFGQLYSCDGMPSYQLDGKEFATRNEGWGKGQGKGQGKGEVEVEGEDQGQARDRKAKRVSCGRRTWKQAKQEEGYCEKTLTLTPTFT